MEEIIKMIENTEYWDARILDLKILYFGDEIQLVFEYDESIVYQIKFLSCYKMTFENSYTLECDIKVRDMNWAQLGYFMQNITVSKYDKNEDYMKVYLDLSIMTMEIVCKNITVKKMLKDSTSFFWEDN